MKLLLANGAEIYFGEDRGIGDLIAYYDSMSAAVADQAKVTPENVSHIRTLTDSGDPIGEYFDLIIVSTEIIPVYASEEEEETVSGYELHIHLREKTDMEKLSERVDALEDSQGTQDEAIDDLGYAVSELYEQEG